MNKKRKAAIFVITIIVNVLFYYLCGYWQQMKYNITSYIDLLFGVLSLILLGVGEVSVAVQLFYRNKYKNLKKRVFELQFVRQCVLLILFYVCSLLFTKVLIFINTLFYLPILALCLSVFWTRGSRILWTGEEESFYLSELGMFYRISNITENDDVIELTGIDKNNRDRNILIRKRNALETNIKGADYY